MGTVPETDASPPAATEPRPPAFDESRLKRQPGQFDAFDIPASGDDSVGVPLAAARLPAATELMTFRPPSDPAGPLRCLRVDEMGWHHVAQGKARGQPFAVSFCGVCNSSAGLTPLVDGETVKLETIGLYNGMVMLEDPSTGTMWDHLTGKAVHGPGAGARMATWSVHFATASEALAQDESAVLYASRMGWLKRQFINLQRLFMWTGILPPMFTATMAPEDTRLQRAALGVGLVAGGAARFYPLTALEHANLSEGVRDTWQGKEAVLRRAEGESVPRVAWGGAEEGFQQFYLRWYGFALTYPHCTVFGQE